MGTIIRKILALTITVSAMLFIPNSFAYNCSGLNTWSNSVVYVGGNQVQHSNVAYQAKWWTQGADPAQNSSQWAVWSNLGACDGGGGSSSGGSSSGGSSSGGSSSGGSSSGGCSSPQYSAGTGYSTGQIVQNAGSEYRCDVSGWCSSSAASAYEPGVGIYWTTAWSLTGTCGGGSSSSGGSSSGGSSSGGSSSGGSSSGGSSSGGSSSGASGAGSSGSAPSRVLVGYWETWHATIHSAGHIPLNDISSKYNIINIAFPILMPDGTMILEDDVPRGEDVPTVAEIQQAQAAGKKVLVSIGGAAAGINLNDPAVINKFIETCVERIEFFGLDGIDIDIETGLVAGASMTQLSTSQQGLINLINGVMDHFGPDFMLTSAPETAYVTGGGVAFGGPYGAYLPVINAVRNRLTWLQMQYYNGIMYGKDGTTYQAGTVEGMVKQTEALIDGFNVAGGNGFFQGLPASKIVIGLPSTPGAGGGYMSPSLVQSAMSQLRSQYPSLRGLMTWSINWDASNGYEFANNHAP